MARLLHFAGCTLASLHPDPLSSFTPRTVEPDDEDDDDDAPKPPNPAAPDPEDTEAKCVEFAKYAEAYYTTLNVRLLLPSSPHPLTPRRRSNCPSAPLSDTFVSPELPLHRYWIPRSRPWRTPAEEGLGLEGWRWAREREGAG